MEVNSINTLSNITGKFWFAHFVEALDIWDRAGLMELSEEVVEVNNSSSIDHPFMPVGTLAHGFTLESLFETDGHIVLQVRTATRLAASTASASTKG